MANSQPATNQAATNDNSSFDRRHSKELGVGTYAGESTVNFLVPIASMALLGGLGYVGLGGVVKKVAPGLVGVTSFGKSALEAIKKIKINAAAENSEELVNKLTALKETFGQDFDKLETLSDLWHPLKNIFKDPEKLKKLETTLDIEFQDTSKLGGAAVGALAGSIIGGTAIGYKKWRKDERTRLAATEINDEVSKLELFKPSDKELSDENKRLRAMLTEHETVSPSNHIHSKENAHHEGMIHDAAIAKSR